MTEELTIELDDAREVMYDNLYDEHGEVVDNTLEQAVVEQLTYLYDNKDQLQTPEE